MAGQAEQDGGSMEMVSLTAEGGSTHGNGLLLFFRLIRYGIVNGMGDPPQNT